MKAFPFISQAHALLLLRVVTALLFMAHAVVRIANGTIPNFAKYMQSVGFPQPTAVVWAITLCELIAGTLIITGYYVRWAATSLFIIAATGIVLIHRHFGWFVGEHGTGGSEYSVALMIMLIVVATTDREKSAASSTSVIV
ncbi:MAG: DoxX family protein [Chakrabartia sp.]